MKPIPIHTYRYPQGTSCQPVYKSRDGRWRFRENAIVRWLIDSGKTNLNEIAVLPGVSKEDREQFWQLIGYDINGFFEIFPESEAMEEIDAKINNYEKDTRRKDVKPAKRHGRQTGSRSKDRKPVRI